MSMCHNACECVLVCVDVFQCVLMPPLACHVLCTLTLVCVGFPVQ